MTRSNGAPSLPSHTTLSRAISGAAKAWVIFDRATWSKCSRPIVVPSAGTGPSEAVALLDAATAMPALSKATKAPDPAQNQKYGSALDCSSRSLSPLDDATPVGTASLQTRDRRLSVALEQTTRTGKDSPVRRPPRMGNIAWAENVRIQMWQVYTCSRVRGE